jgi:hypothetical protein
MQVLKLVFSFYTNWHETQQITSQMGASWGTNNTAHDILVQDIPLCYITITLCNYSLTQQSDYYGFY